MVGRFIVGTVVVATWIAPALPAEEAIVFNRDVRPILSENCFACHGPDKKKRKGDLRLDVRDEVIKHEALVAGKPEESELVSRINSEDPDERMPPPSSRKVLTAADKEILRRWVAQGAVYQGHWAYTRPVKPTTRGNAIDFLVQQRLVGLGTKPSPEADRRTLARRLYFDLVGLPPKPTDVAAFIADTAPALANDWSRRSWLLLTTASRWQPRGSTWSATRIRSVIIPTTRETSGLFATT